MITVLGAPGAAVRVARSTGVELIGARIIFSEARLSFNRRRIADSSPEFIVGGVGFPSILAANRWVPSNSLMLRTNDEIVLSAKGGIYQVEVPEGSQFVANPSNVLAHSVGTKPPRVVHFDSRLDIIMAWSQWLVRSSASVVKQVMNTSFNMWKAVTKREPVAWSIPWPKWSIQGAKFWKNIREKAFEITHKKKLKYEGPCSLIVKP